MRQKRSLPLADVLLASPCDVPWEVMVGDNRVRHCLDCKRDVFNLSAMTQAEVESFLEAAAQMGARGEEKPCIALYQRTDGTILTTDCPVGVRRRRIRSLIASTMGVGIASLMAFTALALLKGDELKRVMQHESPRDTPYIPTAVAPPRVEMGHVRIDGTVGTQVFEDGKHIGIVPLSFPTTPGTHVYQFKFGHDSQTLTTFVNDRDVSHLHVAFEKPSPKMVAGRMPVPNMKGGI